MQARQDEVAEFIGGQKETVDDLERQLLPRGIAKQGECRQQLPSCQSGSDPD